MDTRRSFRQSLGQLLLVTLLGVPLITPLLSWTAVPCTHDGHLHVHRIAAMRHAWENGIYFSRWVPDLAFGYGYPFFVFREPGPLYAILGPHLLGLPMAAASNLFYALTILAAGWFMFLWVRDIAGARAGFVSAVAYMAAPYILLDALVRGNAPETLALPLFPFLLWLGRRWLVRGTWVTLLFGILGFALLSLSHNISTLIFTPTLLVYLLAVGLLNRLNWKTMLLRLALLFGLGLGITFFYTGGALLEMDQVTLSQSTVTRNNDFHFNFASLSEILAPAAADDANLVNPPLPIRLGWIPLALALIGATTPLWKRWTSKEQRGHVVLMLIGTVVFLFMALPVSLPLWEGIPLIDFVQFPWRFIGRAALPIAFLAGMPFMPSPVEKKDSRRRLTLNIATLAAIALLILEAIPALYPRSCEEDPFPTIVDVHDYEAATGLVGVDPEGSYFPRTVRTRPHDSPLQIDYQEDRTPQRFDLSALPEGAMADVEYEGFGATITLSTPESFTAQYFSFFYPGWKVTVDGQPVPIIPSDPEGLITFQVPEGEHTVTVAWGSIPLRSALTALSLLALGAAMVMLFTIRSRSGQDVEQMSFALDDRFLVIGLVLVAAGLLAFKLLPVDRELTSLHVSGEPVVDYPASLYAAELQFAGHNLRQEQVAAGDTFDIDLAWKTVVPTLETYQSNIWLEGPDGLMWSEKETYRPRLYEDGPETWERAAGQWAWDSREVEVLSGTPPGTYDVVLTLFDRNTLQPVTLVEESGAVVGPASVIDQIEVSMPDQSPSFRPQYPLEIALDDGGLTLLGFSQDRSDAVPGDEVLLTLFWERTEGPLPDSITIRLLDAAGQIAHTWMLPVIRDGFDTTTWSSVQRLRAQHLLRLPATLASGEYQFQLQDQIPLAGLSVTAPDRVFTAPQSETAVEILFGDEALLSGYSVAMEGDNLLVMLVWQALQEMDTSYNVFVHLVDEQETIVAQSDVGPGGWTRPTTGWVSGEYVLDSHSLKLPPGSDLSGLRLRVGLYDPESGQRLPTSGGNAADLPLNE